MKNTRWRGKSKKQTLPAFAVNLRKDYRALWMGYEGSICAANKAKQMKQSSQWCLIITGVGISRLGDRMWLGILVEGTLGDEGSIQEKYNQPQELQKLLMARMNPTHLTKCISTQRNTDKGGLNVKSRHVVQQDRWCGDKCEVSRTASPWSCQQTLMRCASKIEIEGEDGG